MKTLQEFRNVAATPLNESKVPFSVLLKFNTDRVLLNLQEELRLMAPYYFGKDTVVSFDLVSREDSKGRRKTQLSIIPQDKSTLTKANIDKLRAAIVKFVGVNFGKDELSITVGKADATLEGITPGSHHEKIYKTLFGNKAVKVGQSFKVLDVTFPEFFTVNHIVSNDVIVGDLAPKNVRHAHQVKTYIFVKGRGVFTEKTAPAEFKKYL